jgi:hypothetical protein
MFNVDEYICTVDSLIAEKSVSTVSDQLFEKGDCCRLQSRGLDINKLFLL